ncbi:MAG: hypothetical protein Q8S32_11765 [Burkholderiaceae bacterium]|nr:hypothetical protein [Burkholderiaceae bacterium]
MLILEGLIHSIIAKPFRNKQTGETGITVSANIIDVASTGEPSIVRLKIDESAAPAWQKAQGKSMRAEVRPWHMVNEKGGETSGYALVDKKALPNVI